jgi:hypothetical protein
MIHIKITNVLLFLLIASLWFLAYTFIQLNIDMRNHQIKQEIKALKQELTKKETNKQNDFQPPELEDNPAILYHSDYVKSEKVIIPGSTNGN